MTSLRPNLVKRIERLPKPTNTASAMQPLFEAISNAIHSTQHKYQQTTPNEGRVIVTVSTDRKKEDIWATVEDNGFGLDDTNWRAFTTTDTDNKIQIGGKGVGRLLWLDCFQDIIIKSVFKEADTFKERSFNFVLSMNDQIQNEKVSNVSDKASTSFFVKFKGLRDNGYKDKFPGRGNFIFQHLTSHFLPVFIGGRSPQVSVIVGDEERNYPAAINDIVFRTQKEIHLKTSEYGELKLTLMECDKVASSDLKGSHFIHFIAHDRTVHSQNIDAKLGLKYFGDENNHVFHAILTGEFLDNNVNQQRTAFQFEDATFERIINNACFEHIQEFLKEPLSRLKNEQQEKIKKITESYPSVEFGDMEDLQEKLPSGELNSDAIYGHLSRERFRRDQTQARKIKDVLNRLKVGSVGISDFESTISEASKALEEAEQKSLAEYIVRRKVVLDFIEILLQKVRDDDRDSAYQREDILHSFICPLRISTAAEGGKKIEPASSHDLWIIDERLTFTQYFSSDVAFSDLSSVAESSDRPDLLIFDYVHGLRETSGSSRLLLVEFKRPGRTNYPENENPQLQVEKYIRKLQSGNLTDVRGRPIKLNDKTIFHCFIVADIVGKLDDWTYSWQRTADGRGRIYKPQDGFNGSIELIGWDALLEDAKARNQAFFDKAGISGKSFFTDD